MRRLLARLSTALASLMFVSALALGTAHAVNLYNGVDCSGKAAASSLCQDKSSTANPISGTNGVILTVTRIVATIGGVIAIIVIMLSGFKYITAGGDPGETSKARHSLLYAVAGLVVIALAQAIIGFVIGKIAN